MRESLVEPRGDWVGRSCPVAFVQLLLDYSWARPAVFAVGKG